MKILIHVGLPKTATTMLQNEVFYKLHQLGLINFLGRSSFTERLDFNPSGKIVNTIIRENSTQYKLDKEYLLLELENLLDHNKLNVISEELLTITRLRDDLDYTKNMSRLLDLLSEYNPSFLLTTRRQEDLIYSLFIEYLGLSLSKNSSADNLDISSYITNGIKAKTKGDFKMFYFDKIIESFSGNPFNLIAFELLKKDPEAYRLELEKVLNLRLPPEVFSIDKQYNVKSSEADGKRPRKALNSYIVRFFNAENIFSRTLKTTIKKVFNKDLRLRLLNYMRGIKFKGKKVPLLTDAEKNLIRKEFSLSNNNSSKLSGVDLKKFNYAH